MHRPRWWGEAARVRGTLVLLALFAGATAATAAAVPYQISRSDRAIVDDAVGGAGSLDRDVTLTAPSDQQYSNAFMESVAAASRAAMPPQLSGLVSATDISVVSSGEFPIMHLAGPKGMPVHLQGAALPGYESRVRFDQGVAPSAQSSIHDVNGYPPQATITTSAAISKTAADALGLHVGSVLKTAGRYAGGREDITYTITGLYAADDPGDAVFWRYAPDAQGLGLGTICGYDDPVEGYYVNDPSCAQPQSVWRVDLLLPSVADVDAMSLVPGTGRSSTTIEFAVDPSRVHVSALAALSDAVHRTIVGGQGLALQDPGGHPFPVEAKTRLDVLVGNALSVERQARLLDYVVLGATLAGALAAFFLMLRTVVTRRASEIVLCKARGAAPGRLALRFAAQSGLVVAFGAAAGVLGATVAGVAAAGTVRAWPGAVLVTLAGVASVFGRVAAHPDQPGAAHREPADGGAGAGPGADAAARIPRLVRDIAVPLGAAAAVGVLRSRGTQSGSGSFDWLAIAAPALLAFAAALVVVRLVPVLWSVPFAVARRRRGALSFVAAALAGRRVRVLAAPLAGLVVATAAATFAARLDSAVTQGVRDDALYAVGAGARVEAIPDPSAIALNGGATVSLPAGFAAKAAAVPGAGQVLTAFVGAAGISGVASAPANVAVLAADSGGLRALTRRAASESGGRSGQVPADWPMRPSRPGTVTALVSPGLAGLVGTHATLALPAETVEVDFVAAADLPTASVIAGEYGPGYVVLPADQMGAKAVKPDAVWVTGHPDIKALRALPGVQPYFPSGSYAQASAAGYADGRTTAAHAVLRMAELLSVGFGLLCLAQTMAGSRSAARDSALLLRVLGLSESGGRLLGPATTLPLLALATAGGLAMGASFAPLLGAQVPGVPRDGWLVPVIGVVAVCTVGGVVLEAALRRRERASVRLRAAEFE
ncbi:putative ABC transport system permease protein [Catenulispora sp. MAP5-51]|uniref:hypothetical protein n=1 Tax=Catenulispora sp. MAP5-51 TaxID=3156298 RepID=UPI003511955D